LGGCSSYDFSTAHGQRMQFQRPIDVVSSFTGEATRHAVYMASNLGAGMDFMDSFTKAGDDKVVHVTNPLTNSTTFNGKSSYTKDQIVRWDIFKVTPNPGIPNFAGFVNYSAPPYKQNSTVSKIKLW